MTKPAAQPVAMDRDFALYHPAGGATGFVLCSSWGYDEICSRKFLVRLAETLAEQGYPCLRFDYPGTVDALDPVPDSGLEGWIERAASAAKRLQALSGCKKVVLFGFGIGGAIAHLAAAKLDIAAGVVLAAPVTSGRRYIRELQMQAKVADQGLGLALQGKHGDTGFVGFKMSEKLQADFKSMKLDTAHIREGLPCLILCRENNTAETELAGELDRAGAAVTRDQFKGHLELLAAPTTSILPWDVIEAVSDWAIATFPVAPADAVPEAVSPDSKQPVVSGEDFCETPVRFGSGNHLFGVLCRPKGQERGPVFVFLNTGYCHHIGWGRIWVRASRTLARQGYASFRFDMSNVGDSPADANQPEQVLYTGGQFEDIRVALNYLKSMGVGPAVVVGRCSGAYAGLNAAARCADVDGLMLINQLKLVWDPEEDVYEALNNNARPLDEYRRRAFRLETFQRLVQGKIDIKSAARHVINHGRDRIVRKLVPYLGSLTKLGRFRKECHDMFRELDRRKVPVRIINCETDGSLDELARYFGPDYSGLEAYPNVRRTVVENADHNLTPEDAQIELLSLLAGMAAESRWADTICDTRVADSDLRNPERRVAVQRR